MFNDLKGEFADFTGKTNDRLSDDKVRLDNLEHRLQALYDKVANQKEPRAAPEKSVINMVAAGSGNNEGIAALIDQLRQEMNDGFVKKAEEIKEMEKDLGEKVADLEQKTEEKVKVLKDDLNGTQTSLKDAVEKLDRVDAQFKFEDDKE